MLEAVARLWWVLLLRGIISIGFGVVALVWPTITIQALVLVFGVYAIVDGVLDLGMGIRRDSLPGTTRWLMVLMGLLGIGAGIIAFAWPGITALALLYVIAFWAILTGVFEISAAIRLRSEIDNEWFWILSGALSVILGVLLIVQPQTGALALVTVIGAFSVAWGLVLVLLSFRVRRLAPAT